MRIEERYFDIEISTPPDPARAFKAHTTYLSGQWKGGPTFAFKKVGAFDRAAIMKAAAEICFTAMSALEAVENTNGGGI